MRRWINGEDTDVVGATTVAELIAVLRLETRKVAVERNREIVPRSTYASVRLTEGDRIEIVAFIGGG